MEALQGGLAGVAGGGGEDDDLVVNALQTPGGGDELGQHGQGHILERGGRAPEQLQHIAVAHGDQRRQIGGLEFIGIGPADQRFHVGIIRQQRRKDALGHALRIAFQGGSPVKGKGLKILENVQPAVRRDAAQHGSGGGRGQAVIPGALVIHKKISNLFLAI